VILRIGERGNLLMISDTARVLSYLWTHTALGNDVVRIGFAEARTLEKVHDIRFASTLFIKTVFVFLKPNSATQNDLVPASWKTIVRVIEDYFN
jgi:hypothetical protein